MSDFPNEIRDACKIIINQGNLSYQEKRFLEKCILDTNPQGFLENNCEEPVFLELSAKLAKILGEEE